MFDSSPGHVVIVVKEVRWIGYSPNTSPFPVNTTTAELEKNLGKKFVVSGYVKPGAGMSAITHTVKEESEKLKSDDVGIVWGGDQMT